MTDDRPLVDWLRDVPGMHDDAARDLAIAVAEGKARIGRAYRELLSGYGVDTTGILKVAVEVDPVTRHGVVVEEHIPFISICAHHFLPFFGTAAVSYVPKARIIGLGKIPRLVDAFARRFQLQELLTEAIVRALYEGADARGTSAILTARHLCMSDRGPLAHGTLTTTTFALGELDVAEQAKNGR